MSFPLTAPDPRSLGPVQSWQQITQAALSVRATATLYLVPALNGTLTKASVKTMVRELRSVSDAIANVAGTQVYARIATGNAAFDLSTEVNTLRNLIRDVYVAAGNLVQVAVGATTIDNTGAIVEGSDSYTFQQSAALATALQALVDGIG